MRSNWIKSIGIFILFLFILINGCEKSTIYEDNVTVDFKISDYSLSNNDTLTGTFTVRNNSQKTVTFQFVNSCQFGYIITIDGETIFNEPSGCRLSPSELHWLSG